MMKKISVLFILIAPLLLVSCNDSGEIRIRNSVGGATLTGVRWGDVLLTSHLYPGERSQYIRIADDPRYGIDLPARFPISMYMNVNGDLVYLETVDSFGLDIDEMVSIEITDTTRVTNSVVVND